MAEAVAAVAVAAEEAVAEVATASRTACILRVTELQKRRGTELISPAPLYGRFDMVRTQSPMIDPTTPETIEMMMEPMRAAQKLSM